MIGESLFPRDEDRSLDDQVVVDWCVEQKVGAEFLKCFADLMQSSAGIDYKVEWKEFLKLEGTRTVARRKGFSLHCGGKCGVRSASVPKKSCSASDVMARRPWDSSRLWRTLALAGLTGTVCSEARRMAWSRSSSFRS